jgi:tetratricopeptide (TPR) repeat protein
VLVIDVSRPLRVLAALGLATLVACARPAEPRLPTGHDYVFPSWERGEVDAETSRQIQKAWRDVLSGKTSAAAKRFTKLLEKQPGLIPAETGLAFARLRAGRLAEARRGFEDALRDDPCYFPALVGAASAASRLGDTDAALSFYREASRERPEDTRVRRRLAELKLQVTERRVAAAGAALGEGRIDDAVAEYRYALEAAPELGSLRVALADLLLEKGEPAAAVSVLEADPGLDRSVVLRLGEMLTQLGEPARALAAYRRFLERLPDDAELRERAHAARQALELLQMPAEYRRIPSARRVTRADLAALLDTKLTALSRVPEGEPSVAVDITGSWARRHIIAVLARGLMPVYPNHTFQPGATVRRGDLASAIAGVLDLLEWPSPPAPPISDMSRNNLLYKAAHRAVGAGLMDLTPGGAFESWRPVSGQQAVELIEALARLVGP